ncbi:DUF2079 domain-containing protein [Candidatus Roizmanbacteria bacterium]|nr:DUF2079 domain-containing protein [Candidatus Roizmanbacteria bacterium]
MLFTALFPISMKRFHVLHSLQTKIHAYLPAFVVGVTLLYITFFSTLAILRLITVHSHYYDLGIMDQTVFNTATGHFLELTNPHQGGNTSSRLAIHFDPLLAIFAPIYALYSNPAVLLVGQAVIVGLGIFLIYHIALSVLKSRAPAFGFALLFASNYIVQNAIMFDFHAVTLVMTTLLAMYLFFVIQPLKRTWINTAFGYLFLILSLMGKENVGLTTAFFGLYLLCILKRKVVGLTVVGISLLTMIAVNAFIIPHFSYGLSPSVSYYDIKHPASLLARLWDIHTFEYVLGLIMPVGFLSLVSPLSLLVGVPEILVNLTSSNANMSSFAFQYTSVIIPFVFISAINGYGVLLRKIPIMNKAKIGLTLFSFLLAGNCLLIATNTSWIKINYSVNQAQLEFLNKWRAYTKDPSLIVSTSGSLAPFFTERRTFIDFFYDPSYQNTGRTTDELMSNAEVDQYEKAKYILLFEDDTPIDNELSQYYYNKLKTNADYKLIDQAEGIVVYAR